MEWHSRRAACHANAALSCVCYGRTKGTAKLCTLTSFDPTRIHPDFISVPTPLTSLTPTSFRPFFRPANRIWSHLQFSSFLTRPKCDKLSEAMRSKASESTINHTAVFIYPIPHPDHFVTGFLVAQDDNIISHGFSADHNQLTSAARATVFGAQALSRFPLRNTFFFLPSRSLHLSLLSLHKHPHLPSAALFTNTVDTLLFIDPSIFFTFYHVPV